MPKAPKYQPLHIQAYLADLMGVSLDESLNWGKEEWTAVIKKLRKNPKKKYDPQKTAEMKRQANELFEEK